MVLGQIKALATATRGHEHCSVSNVKYGGLSVCNARNNRHSQVHAEQHSLSAGRAVIVIANAI